MGSRLSKSFLIESTCWVVVILTVMFLVEPLRTTNSLERPDKYPIPLGIALAFGLSAAYLRSVLIGGRRTLKARMLVLEDEAGKSRLLLDACGKYPSLQFWTSDGLPRLLISGDDERPALSMFAGPELKSSIELAAVSDGSQISLRCGQTAITLNVDESEPEFSMTDGQGNRV